MLVIKLRRVAELERQRQELEAFMREPGPPVDPEWLAEFMGWRDG